MSFPSWSNATMAPPTAARSECLAKQLRRLDGDFSLLLGDSERTAAGARANAFVGDALVLQVGAGSSCGPKRKRRRRVRPSRSGLLLGCWSAAGPLAAGDAEAAAPVFGVDPRWLGLGDESLERRDEEPGCLQLR